MLALVGILAFAVPVVADTPQPTSLEIQEVTVYQNYRLDYDQLYIIKYYIGYDDLPTDAANKLFVFRLFDEDDEPVAIVRPYPYNDKGYGMGVAAFYLPPGEALGWETTLWDAFEWGSDGDPIDDSGGGVTWTIIAADDSLVEIDTAQRHGGTRSALLYRGLVGGPVSMAMDHEEAARIQFWARKSNTAQIAIVHGDGSKRIRLYPGYATEIIRAIEDGGNNDTGAIIPVDTWYKIEIANIDWTAGTYDVYLNDALVLSAEMYTDGVAADQIVIHNNGGTESSIWIDDLEFGQNTAVYLTGDPLVDWEGGIPSTSTDVMTWRTGTTAQIKEQVAAKILSLAAELEQEWGVSLTETSQGTTALNSAGQAYFQAVIPYLMDTVPYVLGRYVFSPDYPIDPKPPANNYADELANAVSGTIFDLSGPARSFGITTGQLTAALYYIFVVVIIALLIMKAGLRKGAMLIAWPFVIAGAFFGVGLFITILAGFVSLLATVWVFYKGVAT